VLVLDIGPRHAGASSCSWESIRGWNIEELVIIFLSHPPTESVPHPNRRSQRILGERCWERLAKGGCAQDLSQEKRDYILSGVLLRILVTIYVRPRSSMNYRTTLVNSGILPPASLNFDQPKLLVSAGANMQPERLDIRNLCGGAGPVPAFETFEAAAQATAPRHRERDVRFRSLEEYKGEVGQTQFMLETDDQFVL
jgi:hypothetical protein